MTGVTIADVALGVSLLALTVSILSYRHSARPRIMVKWKVPRRLYRAGVLYCFFEGTFTNRGGKPVSLLELNNRGEPLAVVSETDLTTGLDEETITSYTSAARLFLLAKPIQWYLSDDRVRAVDRETELVLSDEIAIDVSIAAGTTYRLALCFQFPSHEPITKKGAALYVRFRCMLNNGQSTEVGVAADGHPLYSFTHDFDLIVNVT